MTDIVERLRSRDKDQLALMAADKIEKLRSKIKEPCGECHLQENEVCNICGATQ